MAARNPAALAVERLPERFRGGDTHLSGIRFRIHLGRIRRDVLIDRDSCEVVSSNEHEPDVEIRTDPETWLAMYAGKLSGIEAFGRRRLTMRGSIEKSLQFETLFERPDEGGLRYSLEIIENGAINVSALMAGSPDRPPLLLLHGLAATKASWLTVVPQLAKRHRVIALDLPGFGRSSKPRGAYDAPWFADQVRGVLDALSIDRAFLAGNSMGGRVAMETAMRHPERVEAIACLCPAAAFNRRPALWLVKLLRPELGMVASRLPRDRIRDAQHRLFADPSCIHESWYDAAIDDFLDTWRSPRSRRAFFTALRNIYLDEPEGENGFWTRLRKMEAPALFFYGECDELITHHFARKIASTLPKAKVLVWEKCGHVPQIEFPDRTAREILRFFDRAAATKIA
jgi:pimeloyl-ACP methyl ester carboxylesterase/putative sterol carrier protein